MLLSLRKMRLVELIFFPENLTGSNVGPLSDPGTAGKCFIKHQVLSGKYSFLYFLA